MSSKANNGYKTIMGIDPAINNMGWSIIRSDGNNISYIASGVVKNNHKDIVADRIVNLHDNLQDIITKFVPDEIAIEETFVNKNPSSSLTLGHARGAIILSCRIADIPIFEYSATKVKKTIVGVGRAEKAQVKTMVKFLLPKITHDLTDDESDAIAIAICHVNNLVFINKTNC